MFVSSTQVKLDKTIWMNFGFDYRYMERRNGMWELQMAEKGFVVTRKRDKKKLALANGQSINDCWTA